MITLKVGFSFCEVFLSTWREKYREKSSSLLTYLYIIYDETYSDGTPDHLILRLNIITFNFETFESPDAQTFA